MPQDASRSGATQIPLPIVYMAVYATRARAELIHMNHIIAEQTDRKELLEKCAFWCESNILLKTQRVLPAKCDVSMKMSANVFSTQQSSIINVEQFS